MRLLYLFLLAIVVAIQYPLWWSDSGWTKVAELRQQLSDKQSKVDALTARNGAMEAEVQDLKSGTAALEDRARSEMSLITDGEVFVQVVGDRDTKIVPTVPLSVQSALNSTTKTAAQNKNVSKNTKAVVSKNNLGPNSKSVASGTRQQSQAPAPIKHKTNHKNKP